MPDPAAAPRVNPEKGFLDFHLIVNSVTGESDSELIIVVADAPVSRWGAQLDRLHGSDRIAPLMHGTVGFRRGVRGDLSLDWPVRDAEGPRAGNEVSAASRAVKVVQEALFSMLFARGSDALRLLTQSCQRANLENKYLRLKLELPSVLANLPWEIMECPQNYPDEVTLKGAKLSIVRYLGDIAEPLAGNAAAAERKGCLLVILSDPSEYHNGPMRDSFRNELNHIREVLEKSWLDCEIVEGCDTLEKLRNRVQQLERSSRPIMGFHYIGHGGVDDHGGFLVGEDSESRARPIYEDELRNAFDPAESVRWILLNACKTAFAPIREPLASIATSIAVIKNVPTVIAYTGSPQTKEAESIGPDFYRDLLHGEASIEEIVRALQLRYRNPGGLVVFTRSVAGKMQTRLGTGATPAASARVDPPPVERRPEPAAPSSPPPARQGPAPEDVGEMIEIPAGRFRKGLSERQIEQVVAELKRYQMDVSAIRAALKEEREESVHVGAFAIDATPVTNAQFARFVEATNHVTEAELREDDRHTWRIRRSSQFADHPVVYVSFNDAQAYCEWAGKRLPTADEWKKAFRGSEGRMYPWGDAFDVNRCNTAESQRGWETTPVRRFPDGRSPYGCYDMLGNVEEWTTTTSTEGASELKIVLGGSWCMSCQLFGIPVLHRLAARDFSSNELGFRGARTIGGGQG